MSESVPQLWPPVPTGLDGPGINGASGVVSVDIFQEPNGKPVCKLEVTLGLDRKYVAVIWVTANVLEMLGGAARGARLKYEDAGGRPGGR